MTTAKPQNVLNKLRLINRPLAVWMVLVPVAAWVLMGVLMKTLSQGAIYGEMAGEAFSRLHLTYFGLIWLVVLCAFPFYVLRWDSLRSMAPRLMWASVLVIECTLVDVFTVGGVGALISGLMILVSMVLMTSACFMFSQVFENRLPVALGVSIVGLILFGCVFWMNPLLGKGGLSPEGRQSFVGVVMHVAPIPVLCDAASEGEEAVRGFESPHFSYHYSLLSSTVAGVSYPQWDRWMGIHLLIATSLFVTGGITRWTRQRRSSRVSRIVPGNN